MTSASLHDWRIRLGYRNKTAAAEALGISRNTYAAYESGEQPVPRLVALACAALAFGLPEQP